MGDDAVKSTKTGGLRNQSEYDYYRKTQAAHIKVPIVLQNAIRKLSEDDSVSDVASRARTATVLGR